MELAKIENIPAVKLFNTGKLDEILAQIAEHAKSFVPDISTDKGRKEVKSVAYKVAKSKTAIDAMGKELVAGWKEQAKKVDAERKKARDFLDSLKEEVLQPVTEWEKAEQDRVDKIVGRIEEIRGFADLGYPDSEEIARVIAGIESTQIDESLFMEFQDQAALAKDATLSKLKEMFARQKKYEDEQAELARLRQEAAEREAKELEERIRKEAEERARIEAESKAKVEQERIEREKQEAIRRQEDAERRAKEAEERAEKAAELARLQEKERAEKEAARLKAEEEKREANKKHKKKIHDEAIYFIRGIYGTTQQQAESIVDAIAAGSVPHVSIRY